jgi:hypothetical protein
MRGWRGKVGCGKTTAAATGKATAATTMGSRGKATASATPTAKMVLRARTGRHTGGSKKDKDERNRTHGFDLHVALFLNA